MRGGTENDTFAVTLTIALFLRIFSRLRMRIHNRRKEAQRNVTTLALS